MTINFLDFTQSNTIAVQAPQENYFYKLDEKEAWALNTAIAINRPLLVTGEPGIGKSQLARAAAAVLDCPYYSVVINSTTHVEDLLWQFDAVSRLAAAQLMQFSQGQSGNVQTQLHQTLHPACFLQPGPLWNAFDPKSAKRYPLKPENVPTSVKNIDAQKGAHQIINSPSCVLLIDEIDKADSDIPNGLLDIIDQLQFPCPHLETEDKWVRAGDNSKPLIIFTSNRDRELPPAFIRRCASLEMSMGASREDWQGFLIERAKCHFNDNQKSQFYCPSDDAEPNNANLFDKALEAFICDREAALGQVVKPGLAEFIDLLRALDTLYVSSPDRDQCDALLDNLLNSITRKDK